MGLCVLRSEIATAVELRIQLHLFLALIVNIKQKVAVLNRRRLDGESLKFFYLDVCCAAS